MYKNNLPGGVRALLGFLSVLLCIVLFVVSVAAILVVDVQTVTSKDGLQSIIDQALFPTKKARVLPKLSGMDLGGLLGDGGLGDLGDLDNLADSPLVDSIYEMIKEQAGEDIPVTKEQVGQILEESTLPEFLSEKVSSMVNDVFTGENTTTITTDEVIQLLEENAPLLEEHFDIQIDQTQMDVVEDWLEENDIVGNVKTEINKTLGILAPELPGGEGGTVGGNKAPGSILDLMDPNTAAPQTPYEILQLVRAVTSQQTLHILLGLCGAIFLLLLLTHWGRPFAAVRSAGIPVMLAGLLMLLPTAAVSFLPPELPFISVIQSIFSTTGNISLIVAAGGLVLIILGAVLNSVCKNAAAKKALAVAEPTIEEQLLAVEE